MDKMIDLYKSQLKLEGCMLSLIAHEDAIVAIVYRVIKPIYLKFLNVLEIILEKYIFLNYFKNILPVAGIIDVVQPSANIHGTILMQYLPGTLLQSSELTQELHYPS